MKKETPAQKKTIATNPFGAQETSLRKVEKVQRAVLWSSTWFVLLIAGLIFGTIAVRGVPVLMKYGSSFITESPETLFVLKIAPETPLQLAPDDFERCSARIPRPSLLRWRTSKWSESAPLLLFPRASIAFR